MKICGIQKLTLLDYPEKLAATVFTAGCNLRCPFCHNAQLVTGADSVVPVPVEEFFDFLSGRKGLLDGVCVTGGEPLLQPDLESFLCKIKDLGFLVKLDTNGTFPQRLKNLIDKGIIDYVAVDIKNSPKKYPLTTGVAQDTVEGVKKTVELLMSGAIPYEFRTTVVRELHTVQDIKEISKWISGAMAYYLQCFKDSGDLISQGLSAWDKETMNLMLDEAKKHCKNAAIRGID